jgi:hypothetical protein
LAKSPEAPNTQKERISPSATSVTEAASCSSGASPSASTTTEVAVAALFAAREGGTRTAEDQETGEAGRRSFVCQPRLRFGWPGAPGSGGWGEERERGGERAKPEEQDRGGWEEERSEKAGRGDIFGKNMKTKADGKTAARRGVRGGGVLRRPFRRLPPPGSARGGDGSRPKPSLTDSPGMASNLSAADVSCCQGLLKSWRCVGDGMGKDPNTHRSHDRGGFGGVSRWLLIHVPAPFFALTPRQPVPLRAN